MARARSGGPKGPHEEPGASGPAGGGASSEAHRRPSIAIPTLQRPLGGVLEGPGGKFRNRLTIRFGGGYILRRRRNRRRGRMPKTRRATPPARREQRAELAVGRERGTATHAARWL